jgi:putative Holliday junction resolvase
MRYLGLDVGDRWIGVALSDPSAKLASPHSIIKRTDDTADMEAINRIITENEVGKVIVGLPRMLDGSIGIQAEKVKAFTQQLHQKTEAEIEFRDEWLTTVAAKHIMHVNGSKKKRRKDGVKKTARQRDDAIAAAVLLQSFLDENR